MSDELPSASQNTDKEIWKKPGAEIGREYYQPSIHVTASGSIGIDVGGHVIVMAVEKWHQCGLLRLHLENLIRPMDDPHF